MKLTKMIQMIHTHTHTHTDTHTQFRYIHLIN